MSAQKWKRSWRDFTLTIKRARFLADPRREALNAGLTPEECAALETIDLVGLELAADSFGRKRAACPPRKLVSNFTRWFRQQLATR